MVVPSDVPSVFLEMPRVAVVLPIWKKAVGSTNRVPYLLRKNFFFMSLFVCNLHEIPLSVFLQCEYSV